MIRWADRDDEQSILKTATGFAHQPIAGLRETPFDRRDGRISVGAVLGSRGCGGFRTCLCRRTRRSPSSQNWEVVVHADETS